MSGVVTQAPGYTNSPVGRLGQLITDSSQIQKQLDTLTAQIGSGKITTTYAGLGATASTSINLNPLILQQQTWSANVDAVSGQMQVAQTALSQISQIASNFFAQTNNLNGLDPATIDSVAASARDALTQVAGLLNSQDGAIYVFGGQDSLNPPVPNADHILSSGFSAQIASAVAGLSGAGATATIAATLAIGGSNAPTTSPFSANMSQGSAALAGLRSMVQVGPGQFVPSGLLASGNGDITSSGTSTTGSYTRDIMRALATIGAMTSSQANVTGFSQLVADTHTSLGDAITALNGDAGVMGNRQTSLQTTKTGLSNTTTALQSQVSGAEDVDMAATLSKLTQVQTQLQASYQLIAGTQSLSLTKFLPVGA